MPLALTFCVALGKSLDLSEPSVLLFYRVVSHGVKEIRNNIHKVLLLCQRHIKC